MGEQHGAGFVREDAIPYRAIAYYTIQLHVIP